MSWSEIEQGVWISHIDREAQVAVVGGMHGDEAMGASVIDSLLKIAPNNLPECSLLIKGNPEALKKGTRGSSTGEDLNRAFGKDSVVKAPYEQRRADILRRVLQPVHRLLDIHQTHCMTPPLAVIQNDPEHLREVARLGLKYAVVGVDKIYAGAMLSDWVDAKGGLGVTLESGMADTPEAHEVGFLLGKRFLGITPCEPSAKVEVFEVDHIIRAPFSDGLWEKKVGNGTVVTKGEELVRNQDQVLRSPGNGILLLPHTGVQKGQPLAVFAEPRDTFVPATHTHPGN